MRYYIEDTELTGIGDAIRHLYHEAYRYTPLLMK